MARPGLRKTYRYSDEFKGTAVKLSSLPEVRMSSRCSRASSNVMSVLALWSENPFGAGA